MDHFGQINMPHQPEGKGRYQHISEAKSLLSYIIYCFLHRKGRGSMAQNDEKLLIKRHLIWSFLQGLICLFVKYLLHVTAR